MEQQTHWSENIIIADANYIDRVASNLIAGFERMIGRHIPQADLARWLDCIALDGGIRSNETLRYENSEPKTQNSEPHNCKTVKPQNRKTAEIQVVLIHSKGDKAMENFVPSNYEEDLNGKAFKDHLGEFCITALEVEDIVSRTQFINDIVGAAAIQKEVKRIMIIPDAEDGVTYDQLRGALSHVENENENKHITMFAMQPMPEGNFHQEILGYSILNALGIKPEEIK